MDDKKVKELGWYILARCPEFVPDKIRQLELHIWLERLFDGEASVERAGPLILGVLLDAKNARARKLAAEFSTTLFGNEGQVRLKEVEADIRERRQICSK